MTPVEIQSELSAIRACLDDLYREIPSSDQDDIRAAVDAISDMVKELEEGL